MNAQTEIWGESEALLEVKHRLSKAAKVNRPVLIIGERGTGKELAAARLHYLSPRWKGPYITLNCAALNVGLAESELFGYEPGAFTGAARIHQGRFEAADEGTLFLDEISHLSLEVQAKILRVVEYNSFQRLGSPVERRVDVRLVAASNVNLKASVSEGKFLPDLLDRLSFEVIHLPPLRLRDGDIMPLAHLFAARMAGELGLTHIPSFSPQAASALEGHFWPGNIRELKNVVERAVYRREAAVICAEDIELDNSPSDICDYACRPVTENAIKTASASFPLVEGEFDGLVAEFAKNIFDQAMLKAKYNQKEAARLLGITYHRFRFLQKKYRLA